MVSFEQLLFGYRYLTVSPDYIIELANIILRRGVAADVLPSGRIRISTRAFSRIKDDIPHECLLSVSEVRGLGGALLRTRRHIPSLVALVLCTVMYFFAGDLVFDIRISGNETVSEALVTEQLRSAGLEIGDRWSKTDKNAVELALLSSSEDISWVSINRVGTVAYVEVVERLGSEKPSDTPDGPMYANIVAERDCVIDEITVVSGTPMVKVGDTVRQGDLLISGIVQSEHGTEYVRAEGVVRGSTSTSLATHTPREVTQTHTEEGSLAYFSLKILNFRINLLNNYGNPPDDCVIIDDVKECTLAGKRLPLTILSGRYAEKTDYTRTYTDSELAMLAGETHRAELGALLSGCDLLSVRTTGGFTDDGYTMESLVVYSTEVGELREIKTEN